MDNSEFREKLMVIERMRDSMSSDSRDAGGERRSSEFRVVEVVPSQDDIWLKDLQRGLTVAVERDPRLYDGQLKNDVFALTEQDRIHATLESQNDLHTIWAFAEIQKLD